ncbi:MAG: hypothetical protein US42_C0001G0065 [Candidatus Magasanikbacteria bacterium GW2011_GWC2_37_14]|uniref:Tryptophan synthase beta chain-like PALP domain-containing protein n=1 Tax=Candidatus Magasanikbacteria bacterium GW2011_GWC2_37_14 TaxID=1619046 RepID=A0A0G0IVP7_9BACT|nr:MAG: hypothetical protein US42_C0001G0065 [Candidatus Magasanikbacteria bacterium GW2011_GWC2_37_14]
MKTIQQSYPELAQALDTTEVYLKREDQHKYGSHKGRSIPLMIKKYSKEGPHTATIGGPFSDFVISSSGNAALAAIHAIQAHNRNNDNKLTLKIFIGENINAEKLKLLINLIEDPNITLTQVENPKQTAFLVDKEGQAKNLRQSTDELALEGYTELAEELNKIPNLQAVFIPTSSGTTAEGLGLAFAKLNYQAQIHIVQTTACHPIVDVIARTPHTTEDEAIPVDIDETKGLPRPARAGLAMTATSLADAIVDQVGHRKEKVTDIIKNSKGAGWIGTDDEILNAIELLKNTCKIKISPNSALAIVGLKKAIANGFKFSGPVVCLITGQ